jgi:signal transduction histidine kinase
VITAWPTSKVIHLDMSLALDAYILSAQDRLAQKAADLKSANEELKKLDVAKRRLTDMIVHDLQNPLAGILAFLQILEAKEEGLTEAERQALREALARCHDLSQLILNVLQLSRAEEGRLDLYIENVDLSEVARRATEAFRLVAAQSGRKLVLCGAERPVLFRTDQSLLSRILYNLLRNALRHTKEGTEVEVRVRAGPPMSISVRDDGPGIPPEIQARIFEPFAARSRGSDSGLGLAFCKMAAESLGWTLRLEAGKRKGACFILEPESSPADGRRSPSAARPGPG